MRFAGGRKHAFALAAAGGFALIESVPNHNMMVPGYEHQTLRCRACGACERHLVFNPGSAIS
jgi:hypothetical protein